MAGNSKIMVMYTVVGVGKWLVPVGTMMDVWWLSERDYGCLSFKEL